MNDTDAWKAKIEQGRNEKNEYLSTDSQSPIPFMKRRKFNGLNYFPPDPKLSFDLELHEHAEKKTMEVKDSKGNTRKFIGWGEFHFTVGGTEYTLQAYKTDAEEERLFIPFKDTTSGKESYGAGRYLDLELKTNFSEGKWSLDFNEAYNPWCAYNHDYACPLVPPENWLKVSIEAGEKSYS